LAVTAWEIAIFEISSLLLLAFAHHHLYGAVSAKQRGNQSRDHVSRFRSSFEKKGLPTRLSWRPCSRPGLKVERPPESARILRLNVLET
ncbi:hypothetical protein BDY24DRAFT_443761, partial [Mrakia frigida]|uniref:uncharacterized protein n=1 Tax=Mrakia frigida TaxID=29902 RepID=UPI003FCC059E